MPLALPLLGAAAIAAFALYKERKDKDEAAATKPPDPFPPQPLLPGAEAYLPYFVKFSATTPNSVIYAAANVLHTKNALAADTLARNLDATGYAPIALIIRNASQSWAAAGWDDPITAGAEFWEDPDTDFGWAAGRDLDIIGAGPIDARARRLIRQC